MKMDRLVFALVLALGCGDDGGVSSDTDSDGSSSTSSMTSLTTSSTTVDPSASSTSPTGSSSGSESSGSSSEGSSEGSSSGESSSSSGGIDGIPMPFHLTEFQAGTPFPDVDVCFLENSSCDVSDRMGDGEIIGPPDTNLTIDISGGGSFPTRYPVRFPPEGLDAFISTLTQTDVGLLFLALGYEALPPEGSVAVLALDENGDGLAGATISIDPDVAIPVVYFASDGTPDTMLTATEAGLGVFVEVDAGDYEVWVEHPTYDCPASPYAWPGTMPERSALTVVDGIVTITFVFECAPA